MLQDKTTRRQFIRQVGAVSAAGAIGFPFIVPASALGKADRPAPSDRLVMASIGVGGQGRGNMNRFMGFPEVQLVAVCDVDAGHCGEARAEVNKKYGNKDCRTYHDFRELLQRKDIDAVSIGTPDHWHGLIAIAAANAGKDIYCEKPLVNSVAEGREVCEAVYKNKRVLQTGSQERSGDKARYACELVRNGRFGKIHTVRINLPCDDGHHQQVRKMNHESFAGMPIPKELDWDFWLGHTPKVPYHEKRCHFFWRFILAHGGGEMTDRGAHVIDLAQLGLGADDAGPIEFKAEGRREGGGGPFDVFWDYKFENMYSNGVRMIGEAKGPRGLKFEGDDGWIFIHIHGAALECSDPKLVDAAALRKAKEPVGNVKIGRTGGHHRNFLDAVKSRKQPFASAEVGHRTASVCHLNNLAMALGRPLRWDPKKEQFIGDDEANKLLSPKMRAPWKL
ncbi:MAG TPA: Gfo/Idh/MocA family oxidoreductase [Phycisphaerae bacterium]|nr:Gfo/Idh/MocA family oxidoreductase [Phycisphaerae bacterium]HRY68381.1 Gfo/Idh/MocA family oxidoreductase [Phycisphaerae bacterium]HSA27798.1 Gfo/Idh/MocA family oxidoreductase [Phycisphaerae bacterium]